MSSPEKKLGYMELKEETNVKDEQTTQTKYCVTKQGIVNIISPLKALRFKLKAVIPYNLLHRMSTRATALVSTGEKESNVHAMPKTKP
jgi:hypothetical protein